MYHPSQFVNIHNVQLFSRSKNLDYQIIYGDSFMKNKKKELQKKLKDCFNQQVRTLIAFVAIFIVSTAFAESCPSTLPDNNKLYATESVARGWITCHYQRCNAEGYCTYTDKKLSGCHNLTGGDWIILEPGDMTHPLQKVCYESCSFISTDCSEGGIIPMPSNFNHIK